VKPANKFGVTELVQAASNIAGTDWIVRIDDDEFPSARMILFIDRYTKDADWKLMTSITFLENG